MNNSSGIIFNKPTPEEPYGSLVGAYSHEPETIPSNQVFLSSENNELIRAITNLKLSGNNQYWSDFKLIMENGQYEVKFHQTNINQDTLTINTTAKIGSEPNYTPNNFDSFTYKNNQGQIEILTLGLNYQLLTPAILNHIVNADGTLTQNNTISLPYEDFKKTDVKWFRILDIENVGLKKIILISSANGNEILNIDENNQYINKSKITETSLAGSMTSSGSLEKSRANEITWAVGNEKSIKIGIYNTISAEISILKEIEDEGTFVNYLSKLNVINLNESEQLITWSNKGPYEVHAKIYNQDLNTLKTLIEIKRDFSKEISTAPQGMDSVDLGDGKVMLIWEYPFSNDRIVKASIYDNNTKKISDPISLPLESSNGPGGYAIRTSLINENQVFISSTQESNESKTITSLIIDVDSESIEINGPVILANDASPTFKWLIKDNIKAIDGKIYIVDGNDFYALQHMQAR